MFQVCGYLDLNRPSFKMGEQLIPRAQNPDLGPQTSLGAAVLRYLFWLVVKFRQTV